MFPFFKTKKARDTWSGEILIGFFDTNAEGKALSSFFPYVIYKNERIRAGEIVFTVMSPKNLNKNRSNLFGSLGVCFEVFKQKSSNWGP